MARAMANDRLQFAIDRLERMTGRIERLVTDVASRSADGTGDPDLTKRHDQLRAQVKAAVARVDALIASAEH